MSRILKVALLTVVGLLPFQPASAQSSSQAPREEARLWVATSERLLGLGLDSGAVHIELASPEGVRAMAVDARGEGLWVLREEQLERVDLRDLDRVEVVAAIAATAPGEGLALVPTDDGIRVVGGNRVEEFSLAGELLESRSDFASREARAILDGVECVDPIDGDRLRTEAGSVRWSHRNPAVSSPELEIEGVRRAQCDTFGGVWIASSTRVARMNRLGELAVDYTIPAALGELRTIRSDARDGALWLATRQRIFRIGLDGIVQEQFRTEGDEEMQALAFELVGGVAATDVQGPSRKVDSQPALLVAPGSNLGPDEIAFEGRMLFPDSRPIAGMEVVVFADSIARTTTAADGTYLTPPALFAGAGNQVLVIFQKTTPSGRISWSYRTGASPGQTYNLGDVYIDYSCAVGFAAGEFPTSALNGEVRSMVVFDDGSGAALYAAGTFTTAGGVTVNRVAKWNGTQWSALGSGLGGGTSPSVNALVVFDDGTGPKLYAGGRFTSSGSTPVKYVAKWTGTTWAQVGTGLATQVYALAVFNDGTGSRLFAGGSFTTANSITFNRLAKWNGSAWQAVSSGLNGIVRSLAVHDDGSGSKLYVGGLFTQAGGSVAANRIARWSGSAWSAVGTGVSGGSPIQVNALLPWDDGSGVKLYAGGRFTSTGSTTVNHISMWNGAAWAAVGTGLGTQVNALASFDDGTGSALYAAGSFTSIAGTTFNRLARWNGLAWQPVGSGVNGNALADVPGTLPGKEPSLFVGGAFSSANGTTSTRVARLRRPAACQDDVAPNLTFITPLEGSQQGSPTPQLTFGFGDRGGGVQTGTIAVQQNGTALSTSCIYAADTATCELLEPVSGGAVTLSATIRDLAGNTSSAATRSFVVEDGIPPSLAITEPLPGTSVTSARPALRFAYSDAGSGIDTATLTVLANGASLAVECQFGASMALCAPLPELPVGTITISATIRDFQGNLSLPATVQFSVSALSTYSVTLTGTTRFEDGSPAVGARVSFLRSFAATATSTADGSFSLGPIALTAMAPLDLAASVWIDNKPFVGLLNGFLPPSAGVHSVGVITLRKACGYVGEGLPWTASETAIPVDVISHATPTHLSALALFDSGAGTDLFVGGQFNYTSQGTRSQVARWSPTGWQALAAGFEHSSQPSIKALAVFDDGTGPALYAGGKFSKSGSQSIYYFAKWDGETWREVGRGTNGQVEALAVFDDGTGPALYVAGDFTAVGTSVDWTGTSYAVAANRVAKWDGSTWEQVAGGFTSESLNSDFQLAVLTDTEGQSLFLWDWGTPLVRLVNNAWVPLDTGEFRTEELVAFDDGSGPALYRSYQTYSGDSIQQFYAGTWVDVRPLFAYQYDLAVHTSVEGTFLYATDTFPDLPGSPAAVHVRRWNGSTWSAPLATASSLFVVEDPPLQPRLYAVVESESPGLDSLLLWNGSAFEPLVTANDSTGTVDSVALHEDATGASIFFSGLARAGGVELDGGIGRWDGSQVSAAGQGLESGGSKVFRLFDGAAWALYAVAGPQGRVAKWNGSSWTTIGQPIGVQLDTVAWLDLGTGYRLYAAGDGVFRWNGAFWASLNGPSDILALESFGGKLFAGGGRVIEGFSIGVLKQWDGATWSLVGPAGAQGVNGPVYALRAFGGKLHIGGEFDRAGTATYVGYVAWTGSAWSRGDLGACGVFKNRFLPTGGSSTTPFNGVIHAFEVLDDGRSATSARLIVAGDYASTCNSKSGSTFTGTELAYYNVNLGKGADGPPVRALSAGTLFGAPAIAVGGGFGEFDGRSSAKLAIWGTAPSWSECSTASQPPVISVTSPASPFTSASTVIITGSIDEPASLTLSGADVPVSANRTFSSASMPLHEGLNTFLLEATDWEDLTGQIQIDLVRDSMAPSLTIDFPTEGAVVTSTQPVFELAFADGGSGVDAASLIVEVNGVPLATGACVVGAESARCTPGAPLPGGANFVSARIADRAANLAIAAQRNFVVDAAPGAAGTVVTGTVQRSSGAAAAGARVRVLGFSGLDAFAAADGSFALAVPSLRSQAPLTVVAELDDPAGLLLGTAPGLTPVIGGATPAGTIVLGAACDPVFASGLLTSESDLVGRIVALAVFDDGTGPALFAGGDNLLSLGGVNYDLVKWNGARWVPSPLGYVNGRIRALAVFDGGSGPALYAGGNFSSAGGVPAQGLASWNGTVWSPVGGGVTTSVVSPTTGLCLAPGAGAVYALKTGIDVEGPALFVGGDFLFAGGVPADLAARWNGAGWSGVPGPPCHTGTRRVEALAVYDDGDGATLHAGGYFSSIGGTAARSVAKLAGTSWVPLAQGVGIKSPTGVVSLGLVSSMAVFDSGDGPELVVGGLFGRAGDGLGVVQSLARWNGVSWASVGDGLEAVFTSLSEPSGIQALAVFDDGSGPALFATGSLSGASEAHFHGIAKWNGNSWLPLANGLEGTGTGGMAMVPFAGELVVSGGFTTANGVASRGVARWGAAGWSVFGSHLTGSIAALSLFDDGTGPALYAGGTFLSSGARTLSRIARWSGSAWEPVGAGFNGDVRALAVFSEGGVPALFAGGAFTLSGSTAMTGLAKWDGSVWSPVGGGVMNAAAAGIVEALAVHTDAGGPALFVGGTFTLAGGVSANRVARWDGVSWSALGTGLDNTAYTLTTANVGGAASLFAGGSFTYAGGIPANRVAKWDGTAWSALGTGANNIVSSLEAWPSSTRAELLAGGAFTSIGGVSAGKLARWNGTAWAAATGGSPNDTVEAIVARQEGSTERVVAGGAFTQVGSLPALRIADWNGTAWTAMGAGAADNSVLALLEQDEPDGRSLWVGGSFTSIGGLDSPAIARWKRPLVCGDTVGPTITITEPLAGSWVLQSRPNVVFSMVDTLSGVDTSSIQLLVDGQLAVSQCATTSTSADCWITSTLPEGTRALTVTVRDLAGNLGTASTSLKIDSLDPVVDFVDPIPGAILTTSTPVIQYLFTDLGSGVDPTTVDFRLDGTVNFSLSCSFGDDGGDCTPQQPIADGRISVFISLTDFAGNRTVDAPASFIVDTQAPMLAITAPVPGSTSYGSPPEIVVAAEEAGSGVDPASVLVALDGAPLAVSCVATPPGARCALSGPLATGAHTLTLSLADFANHRSSDATSSFYLTIDFSPPALAFSVPQNGAAFDPATQDVEIVWSDSVTSVDASSLEFRKDGAVVPAQCTSSASGAACRLLQTFSGASALTASVADVAGNRSADAAVSFTAPTVYVDTSVPVITIEVPGLVSAVGVSPVEVRGHLSERAVLTVNGQATAVASNLTFRFIKPLTSGVNTVLLGATDPAGNYSEVTLEITLDTAPPAGLEGSLLTVSPSIGGAALFAGAPGCAPTPEPALRVRGRNLSTGVMGWATISPDGSFAGEVAALPGDEVEFRAVDSAGNESEPDSRLIAGTDPTPGAPDPSAPGDDVGSPFCREYSFLWSGANAVQYVVREGEVDCDRIAVVRGRVVDDQGQALSGVRVWAPASPGAGVSLTRLDGWFDFAVNGDGIVHVEFAKPEFLRAGRSIAIGSREIRGLGEVTLLPRAPSATTVDLSAAIEMQVVRGSLETDPDGTRRGTVLFPAGTSAVAELPGGGTQALTSLSVRAREYSVGAEPTANLPGALPPGMSAIYVADFSVDEAESAGATHVRFDRALPALVENFVSLPTGTRVAVASWDRSALRWVAEDDGIALEVLAEANGEAILDLDGSGQPANPTSLAARGITPAELRSLASLYAPGQRLLRWPVRHFSVYFLGVGYFLNFAERAGPPPSLPLPSVADERRTMRPALGRFGGSIDAENMVLGQAVPLMGTPVPLVYQSDRVPGRVAPYKLKIPVSGATVPADLSSIEVVIEVEGQREVRQLPPSPNQTTEYVWDAQDAYGRGAVGPRNWRVRVDYLIPGRFSIPWLIPESARTFLLPAGRSITGDPRGFVRLSREAKGVFPAFDADDTFGIGGWGLAIQHRFDPLSKTLFYGDGSRRSWGAGPELKRVLSRVAGSGQEGAEGDGELARDAELSSPLGVSPTRAGGILIADAGNHRIREVDRFGEVSTLAGSGCSDPESGPLGDGGAAVDACLSGPTRAVESPEGEFVYIADSAHGRVRRVERESGEISTFATLQSPTCDAYVIDLDVDASGSVYAAVLSRGSNVFGVNCAGVWKIPAPGSPVFVDDQGDWVSRLALGGLDVDGARIGLTSWNCLFEITITGGLSKSLPAGSTGVCFSIIGSENDPEVTFRGDGQPAIFNWTRLFSPRHLAIARDGTVYFADTGNARVRSITPDGVINTVAGGGESAATGDGYPATSVALHMPVGVALSPDESKLWISDAEDNVVWALGLPSPDESEVYEIPTPDGSAIDVFDLDGNHLRTESSTTRRILWEFTYESYPPSGPGRRPRKLVTGIRDDFDNEIQVNRDGAGNAVSVVAPFGQQTTFGTDAQGFLNLVSRNVGGTAESVTLESTSGGLLTAFEAPTGGRFTYAWDALGRLSQVSRVGGGELSLTPAAETESGRTLQLRSAMARNSSVAVAFPPTRDVAWKDTNSAGLESEFAARRDGTFKSIYPGGVTVDATTVPDSLYAPLVETLASTTIALPGLAASLTRKSERFPASDDKLRTVQRTERTAVNGKVATSTYNASAGRLTQKSPMGRTVVAHLDNRDRVTQVDVPGVAESARTFYDPLGRLERVEQGSGAAQRTVTYAYSPTSGYLESITDPLNRVVRFERDEAGRVTTQILPDLREIGITYDGNGNVTSVTPPTRPAHDFDYTLFDQLETYTPPPAGFTPRATTYAYNLDGQVTSITRPDGQQIVPTYEPSGRLDYVTIPGGTIDTGYDAAGRVSAIAAPGGVSQSFAYTGPLVTAMTTAGPVPGSVGFVYNNDFAVASRTVNGGNAVAFTYDDDGLLTQAGALTLSRNAESGFLETTTLATTSDSRTRTTFAELDTYSASANGASVYDFNLDRDLQGRITAKTETIEGVTSLWEYAYHPQRGWLSEVKKNGVVVENYAYDDNGNRTSWSDFWGSGTATYDDQDRMLTAGPRSYTYTNNGELLTKAAGPDLTGYTYDVRGALTAVTLPTGIAITYVVDPSGRRIGKRVNGTLVKGWIYAGGLSPVAETDGAGAITSTFVYATKGNVPDYLVNAGLTYRIFTDHLGSVRLVVNAADGTVAQRIDYDAYGRVMADSNPGFQPFGFAGGIYDAQTGLTRFGARDYDPEVGRWTAKDPIGFAGGSAGLFEYAGNDPVNSIDPSGTWFFPWELLDVYSWKTSMEQWNQAATSFAANPSWSSGLAAGSALILASYDTGAVILPGLPAAGGFAERVVDAGHGFGSALNAGLRGVPVGEATEVAARFLTTGRTTTALGNAADTIARAELPGYNILRLPEGQWSWPINMQWLDDAVARGDEMLVVTDPGNWRSINPKSILFEELQYLEMTYGLVPRNGRLVKP